MAERQPAEIFPLRAEPDTASKTSRGSTSKPYSPACRIRSNGWGEIAAAWQYCLPGKYGKFSGEVRGGGDAYSLKSEHLLRKRKNAIFIAHPTFDLDPHHLKISLRIINL